MPNAQTPPTFTFLITFLLSVTVGCSSPVKKLSAVPEGSSYRIALDRMSSKYYTDDLSTGGLGLSGLRGESPDFANALQPTVEALRRAAIFHNYRSLLALDEASGYGRLYARYFNDDDQAISGWEFIAPLLFEDQSLAAVLMLQIPDSFDKQNPCLVATASSGSRGIYGAMGVVAAWGLHRKCAVVHTDKGTGTGFHWLTEGSAVGVDGTLQPVNPGAHFIAPANDAETWFLEHLPYRVATKHAHSTKEADARWGEFLLYALDFAFIVLNQHAQSETPLDFDNTRVIGAGVSNGGTAALRAVETAGAGFFDGLVVAEPAINLPAEAVFSLQTQQNSVQKVRPNNLAEVAISQALYLPCAARFHDQSPLGPFVLPVWQSRLETRCQKLKDAGMLTADGLEAQSEEALKILRGRGLLPDSDALLLAFTSGFIWESVVVNYLNAYGAFSVYEHLCQVSYAYTDPQGHVIQTPPEIRQGIFANSGGIVPVGGISLVNDDSAEGSRSLMFSTDAEGAWDLGFDNLLCLREQLAGERVQEGIRRTEVSGDLAGTPTIIVHGRADNLVQVNNSSRPYVVLNGQREKASALRYYEILHAQHFDTLVALPAFRNRYVSLHAYFERALDLMWEHLDGHTALPPSQVVQTKPLNDPSAVIAEENLPPITPEPALPIELQGDVMRLPAELR